MPIQVLRFASGSLLLLAFSSACAATHTSTEKQKDLNSLLARPVLAEGQALAEAQAFCDRRIAVMPHPASWSAWQHEADRIRQALLDNVIFRGVPATWRNPARRVEWLDTIAGGPGYHIKKLRYEALPGLWIPALLYEPHHLEGRVPVVLNVNGHDKKGKAVPYKQIRCINEAKRGMLALNVEWLGMGQLRSKGFSHNRMNQIDLCGTSGLAVFYLAMERALDVLLDYRHADVERVAMTGLSGGGWQTILFSSLDRRVWLANPVAGYSSFKTRIKYYSDLGDSEQAPTDFAMLVDYTELTAMRAPRPTLLTYNSKDDCCFASAHALPPLRDAALPIFELAGAGERLHSHVNDDPGTHNFESDNREALYKMLGDYLCPRDDSYNAAEIDSQSEIQSDKELDVPLPEDNLDFHELAMVLAANLPSCMPPRANRTGPTAESVARVARLNDYHPTAKMVSVSAAGNAKARYWRITLGDDWTVPVVELWHSTPHGTACVAADGGRTAAIEEIEHLLSENFRVLAVDPFYLGESKLNDRGYEFALLVSSVGARPLGVQADQLQAVTRWAIAKFKEPVKREVAIGPRISLAALLATATGENDERPEELVLIDSLRSFREIIENNWSVDKYPELFCFGLFQLCDIDDLVELAKPCTVVRK